MDIIIMFFRDILDGPVYIIVCTICIILICSCIGYLAERSINRKKEKEKYVSIDNPNSNPLNVSVQSTKQGVEPTIVNSDNVMVSNSLETNQNNTSQQSYTPNNEVSPQSIAKEK